MSLNRTLAGLIDTAGDVKSASLDNVSAGLTVYATLNDLPTTGLTSGDQAYVSSTSRFYISNGSGWYNVALVNATPSLTISPTGTIELSTDGSTTTITLTGTDSDYPDAGLTYSVESDGSFFGLGTLSQDSSVFTITPLSEDSATTTESTLTFKASDGISFGSGTRTLTLSFKVQYSNYTTLLLKADSDGTDNQVDASSSARTITEAGNVTSTALSPYHPGGYSTYAGTADTDYISFPASSNYAFGSAWQIELWTYVESWETGPTGAIFEFYNNDNNYFRFMQQTNDLRLQLYSGGLAVINNIVVSGTLPLKNWDHWVITWNNSQFQIYRNGTIANSTNSGLSVPDISTWTLYLFQDFVSTDRYKNGYIRDLKITTGTLTVTGTSYTVPTSPVSADNDTQLLTCHLPYISDGSSNNATPTISGNIRTVRFGPYDYLGYAKADYGGSVYFDGTGDYLQTSSPAIPASGDFTIETWVYVEDTSVRREILSQYLGGSPSQEGRLSLYVNSGAFSFFIGSTLGNVSLAGPTVVTNTWYHLAVVRNSNNFYFYVNGVLVASDTGGKNITIYTGSYNTSIGSFYSGGWVNYMLGYVADSRVVSDAVYTSAFTPPTVPLTAITNTELLTCTNKNEFFDASANAPVMTPSGSVAANTSEVAYSGTSIYYSTRSDQILGDGTKAAFNTLPGDFTIELECKLTSSNMAYAFVFQLYSGSSSANAIIRFGDSGFGYHLQFVIDNGGGTGAVYNVNLVQSDFTSAFRHIAWTRESGTNRVFIDGTQYNVATGTNPSTFTSASWSDSTTISFNNASGIYVGRASYAPLGYLQNVRVTNGLARYTANFTPPTAEFGG